MSPYFPPPSLPLPLLPLLPLPLPPRICWACCGGAKVWPLGGPPPGGELTMQATMTSACSSGAFLPPNGGGAPSPTPSLCRSASLAPSSPSLFLVVGGGATKVLGAAPHLLYQDAHEGLWSFSGGAPKLLLGGGSPYAPVCHALEAHPARGVPRSRLLGPGDPPSICGVPGIGLWVGFALSVN